MKNLQERVDKIYEPKPFWYFIYSPKKIYDYRLSSKNKFINKYKNVNNGFRTMDSMFFTKNLNVNIAGTIASLADLIFIVSKDINNLNSIYGGIGIIAFCLFTLNLISVLYVLHKIPEEK